MHGEHRQARCRQAGQVAEQAAAQHKALNLVLHQVGPGAFDQVHKGEFVFEGQLLHTQNLFQAPRLNGPGLDARVAGHHHAAHAIDKTDARDHAAAGHRLGRVGRVLHEARQGAQRQEGRTGVEQQGHAFTRQQLPAFVEHRFGLSRGKSRAVLQGLPLRQAGQGGLAPLLRHRAVRVPGGFECHWNTLGVTAR